MPLARRPAFFARQARFKGRSSKRTSRRTAVKRQLQRLRNYVKRTLNNWMPEERELAKKELTRLLELIDAGRLPEPEENRRDTQLTSCPRQNVSAPCRIAALYSLERSETPV